MRRAERGSAMVIAMVAIASMLTTAAVLARMQTGSTRATDVHRSTLAGLYCAESGLAAVRDTVLANVGAWNGSLGTGIEPSWLAIVDHDLDNDGTDDFTVALRDNDDEAANDLTVDSDATIFIVSTCVQYPDNSTQVTELVTSAGQRKLWLRTQ